PAVTGAESAGDSDVVTFEVLIRLDSPPPQVRMGMTAWAQIVTAQHNDVLTIPSQAVLQRRLNDLPPSCRPSADETAPESSALDNAERRYYQVVFVESAGQAEMRLVRTGISHRGRVEILDGLRAGERVIAGPYRSFAMLRPGLAIDSGAAP